VGGVWGVGSFVERAQGLAFGGLEFGGGVRVEIMPDL
jgi:hypothetical protein